MNLSRVLNPLKPVSIERPLKSWNIEYNFKWNQPYLSGGSNSLNPALFLFADSTWKLTISKKY